MKDMNNVLAYYFRSAAGVVAVWFGLFIPMVVTAVGVSVDIGQAYLVKERLSQALDAAALAAAANASEDPDVVERRVEDFLEMNYPPDKVGFTVDIDVVNAPETLNVNATAQLNTSFMRIFGKDTVMVDASTEVTKAVKSIEVVLVMDVTGSMGTRTGNKTRIESLKDAARLFTTTMFNRVRNRDQIKIGLVPFSASVNVGPYGLGKTPTGTAYSDSFINNPRNIAYYPYEQGTSPSTTNKRKWWGCILEGATPKDTQDHEGPWDMYRYCRRLSDDTVVCDSGNATNDANIGCPRTMVTPMTNNQTELETGIDALQATGNTYINVGLVWGYRMISPEFPFEEGSPWGDEHWKKAVILMTDGVNEPSSNYSAYGPSSGAGITATKLNNRMLDVCDELKDKNVLVYTITFDKGVNTATKNLFKACATQPSMWYDAPNDEKLQEVYLTIAKELSNLHLSK